MSEDSIIQRAFGLAASGSFRSVAEIEKALKREGFTQVSDHLCGPSLRTQLKKVMTTPAAAPEQITGAQTSSNRSGTPPVATLETGIVDESRLAERPRPAHAEHGGGPR